MLKQETKRAQLVRVQGRLSRWREQHGGRGRPIPEALWTAAMEVADLEGVDATARALDLDRERLSRRVERSRGDSAARPEQAALVTRAGFVEVDAARVFSRGQVMVRLTSRDGEQLEMTLDGGLSALDVTAMVRAFGSRSR